MEFCDKPAIATTRASACANIALCCTHVFLTRQSTFTNLYEIEAFMFLKNENLKYLLITLFGRHLQPGQPSGAPVASFVLPVVLGVFVGVVPGR